MEARAAPEKKERKKREGGEEHKKKGKKEVVAGADPAVELHPRVSHLEVGSLYPLLFVYFFSSLNSFALDLGFKSVVLQMVFGC